MLESVFTRASFIFSVSSNEIRLTSRGSGQKIVVFKTAAQLTTIVRQSVSFTSLKKSLHGRNSAFCERRLFCSTERNEFCYEKVTFHRINGAICWIFACERIQRWIFRKKASSVTFGARKRCEGFFLTLVTNLTVPISAI